MKKRQQNKHRLKKIGMYQVFLLNTPQTLHAADNQTFNSTIILILFSEHSLYNIIEIC